LKRLREDDLRYLAKHPGLRVPSAELRYNVVGACTIPQFLRGGEQTVDDIENALRTIGTSLDQFRDFLDFGCGCGRLLLALEYRHIESTITGCDVDKRAIDWCRHNLDCAKVVVNDALPPSPFKEKTFDLVWAGSVFTHLDEDHQDSWLKEMQRMLKPCGILLASVHGPHLWETRLPSWTIAKLRERGMMYVRTNADSGIHPDWYQVAWHTEEYIRNHWAPVFDILGYLPRGFNDYQDIIVARKKG